MNKHIRICPICNQLYSEPPALSRKDNKTEICSLCGTREALESFNLSKEEHDMILDKAFKTLKGELT